MKCRILLLVGLSLTSAFPYKKQMQDGAFEEHADEAIDQGRYETERNDRKTFQSETDFTVPNSYSEKKIDEYSLPKNDGINKWVEAIYPKTKETNYRQTRGSSQPVDTEDKKSDFTETEQIVRKEPLNSDLLYKEEKQNSTFQKQPFEETYEDGYKKKLNDSEVSHFESGPSFSYSIPEKQTLIHSIPKSDTIKKWPEDTFSNKREIKYGHIVENSQPINTEDEKTGSKETGQSNDEERTDIESQSGMILTQTYSDEIPVGNKASMNNDNTSTSKFDDNFGVDEDDSMPSGPPMEIIDISPRIAQRRYTEKITKGGANKTELVLKYSSGRVPPSKNNDAYQESSSQYRTEGTAEVEGSESPSNSSVHHLEMPYFNSSTTEANVDPYPDRIRVLYINQEDWNNDRQTRDDDRDGVPEIIHISSRKGQSGNYSETYRIKPSNRKQNAGYNHDDVVADLEPASISLV